jgi:alpha-tubulin suppressor-like RCC1 family protein
VRHKSSSDPRWRHENGATTKGQTVKRTRAIVVFGALTSLALGYVACGDPDVTVSSDAGVDATQDVTSFVDVVTDTSTIDSSTIDAGPDTADTSPPCFEDASGSPFLDDVIDLGVSYQHACAVRSTGRVYCWGVLYSYIGELPIVEADGGAVVMKKTRGGNSFQCGLDSVGRVWCWGHDGFGQIGKPAAPAIYSPSIVLDGNKNPLQATDIAAGVQSVCAITAQNKVVCWGDASGGFGTSDAGGPVNVPVDTGIVAQPGAHIVAGPTGASFCVVDNVQTTCFGKNNVGQLAIDVSPTDISTSVPAAVADAGGSLPLRDLSMSYSGCAIDQSNNEYCWGYCGDNCGLPLKIGPTPRAVGGLGDAGSANVSVGGGFTCTRTVDQHVFCVGDNSTESLGAGWDSGIFSTPIPRMVVDFDGGPSLSKVTSISSGGIFSCALLENSCGKPSPAHVACWGFNGNAGILGDPEAGTKSPVPVRVKVQ